jgi:hypothetical protein
MNFVRTFSFLNFSFLNRYRGTDRVYIKLSNFTIDISFLNVCHPGCRKSKVAVLPKFAMLSHLDLACVSGKVLLGLLQKTPVINTLVLRVGT